MSRAARVTERTARVTPRRAEGGGTAGTEGRQRQENGQVGGMEGREWRSGACCSEDSGMEGRRDGEMGKERWITGGLEVRVDTNIVRCIMLTIEN